MRRASGGAKRHLTKPSNSTLKRRLYEVQHVLLEGSMRCGKLAPHVVG
jgi:hypothetical protein